jgi:hypothetical protein
MHSNIDGAGRGLDVDAACNVLLKKTMRTTWAGWLSAFRNVCQILFER